MGDTLVQDDAVFRIKLDWFHETVFVNRLNET